MKKVITILLIVFSLSLFSLDFRDYHWRNSQDSVRENEGKEPLFSNDKFLVYEGEVAQFPATIIFTFIDDELSRGMYVLQNEHDKYNDYILDFIYLKELLSKIYGDPMDELDITKSMVENDKRQRYGKKIAQGEKILQSKWVLERTLIVLTLEGKDNKLQTRISYTSFFHLEHYLNSQDEKLMEGL
ncbi:MAG: hypothetical protein SVM86_05175 [Candidatus Cloacimonadota bacterium]|nr:hypothetical protein [Candidatus Cloacimonadota bacterium]